jgi:hypothetical protein
MAHWDLFKLMVDTADRSGGIDDLNRFGVMPWIGDL